MGSSWAQAGPRNTPLQLFQVSGNRSSKISVFFWFRFRIYCWQPGDLSHGVFFGCLPTLCAFAWPQFHTKRSICLATSLGPAFRADLIGRQQQNVSVQVNLGDCATHLACLGPELVYPPATFPTATQVRIAWWHCMRSSWRRSERSEV